LGKLITPTQFWYFHQVDEGHEAIIWIHTFIERKLLKV
jgi:hypothetical protein